MGAACVLMERDRRAGGSRTLLDLARRVEEPRRPGQLRRAAWNFVFVTQSQLVQTDNIIYLLRHEILYKHSCPHQNEW